VFPFPLPRPSGSRLDQSHQSCMDEAAWDE